MTRFEEDNLNPGDIADGRKAIKMVFKGLFNLWYWINQIQRDQILEIEKWVNFPTAYFLDSQTKEL